MSWQESGHVNMPCDAVHSHDNNKKIHHNTKKKIIRESSRYKD